MSTEKQELTVEQVQQKITANQAERERLAAELEEVEQRAILTGDSTPSVLDEIARLQTRLKLANGYSAVLEREYQRARAYEALDAHAAKAEALRASNDELNALETSEEWLTVEKRYNELLSQRQALRSRLVQQQDAFALAGLGGLPDDPTLRAEVMQKRAAIDASVQNITDRIVLNTDQLKQFGGLFRKD